MTIRLGRYVRLRYIGSLLIVTAAACSKADTGSNDTGAAGAPTTGNRRLDADLERVQDFKLSMPRMHKWAQAGRNMEAASKAHPELEGTLRLEQDASIDQQVAALEGHAEAKKAIKDAGLSPREYMMITHAYMQAAAAQSVQQLPPGKQRDSIMQSLRVHPDNVTFVQKNMPELERLMKGMEAN